MKLSNLLGGWVALLFVVFCKEIFNDKKSFFFCVRPKGKKGENFPASCSVSPGLTGMWQVSGRNNLSFADRASFDLYYLRNWSLWLDFYILLRTVWVVVVTQDGAN